MACSSFELWSLLSGQRKRYDPTFKLFITHIYRINFLTMNTGMNLDIYNITQVLPLLEPGSDFSNDSSIIRTGTRIITEVHRRKARCRHVHTSLSWPPHYRISILHLARWYKTRPYRQYISRKKLGRRRYFTSDAGISSLIKLDNSRTSISCRNKCSRYFLIYKRRTPRSRTSLL